MYWFDCRVDSGGILTSMIIRDNFSHHTTLHDICSKKYIPSLQEWNYNGKLMTQIYYMNGKQENYVDPKTNKTIPALQKWNYNGKLMIQIYYIDGKKENYVDPKTNETIPAFQSWFYGGQLNRQKYYRSGKQENYFDSKNKNIIPALQIWHRDGQLLTQKYYINNVNISKKKFTVLCETLTYYIKTYLNKIHQKNKKRATKEHLVMQEYILRPGGNEMKFLKYIFNEKIEKHIFL